MSNPHTADLEARARYREEGRQLEQDRIIKLLEDDCSCSSVEECYCTIGWAIELIKGETE